MSEPQPEPTGTPSRYQRSASGLIVSLVVTVLALGALLTFMGLFRNDTEIRPERIDYLDTIGAAQQAGLTPPYPASLPKGWIATGADVEPGDDEIFMLRLLTDEERFVGVRSEDASPLELVRAWVDEDAEPAAGHTVPDDVRRPLARDWEGYVDDGGDTAYVAELDDRTLIVFGSASAKQLQGIVDSLVTTPLN